MDYSRGIVTSSDERRLRAWDRELRTAHDRLRQALRVAQETAADDPELASRDLLLFCHGFCTALDGHHRGEDALLFPEVVERHPELRETVAKLTQDHSMINYLLGELAAAVQSQAEAAELGRHLEGIAAVMESHFRYEERQLLTVLSTLELDRTVADVLGPL